MEVIQIHKGDQKLLRQGYMYAKKNNSESTVRWECYSRASFYCKGALTTEIEIQRVRHTVPQTDDPNPDSVAGSRLEGTMKNEVVHRWVRITKLLLDTTAPATTEIPCRSRQSRRCQTYHTSGARQTSSPKSTITSRLNL